MSKFAIAVAVLLSFGLMAFDGCDINIGEKNLPHSGEEAPADAPTE